MKLAAFEGVEGEKRWHAGMENTGSGAEKGTKTRVEREDSGDAKVNTTAGEKSSARNESQD